MRMTDEQAEAVHSLRSNADFRRFMSWLEDEAERANQLLVFNNDMDLHELRGRTQVIVEIMKAIDAAAKRT